MKRILALVLSLLLVLPALSLAESPTGVSMDVFVQTLNSLVTTFYTSAELPALSGPLTFTPGTLEDGSVVHLCESPLMRYTVFIDEATQCVAEVDMELGENIDFTNADAMKEISAQYMAMIAAVHPEMGLLDQVNQGMQVVLKLFGDLPNASANEDGTLVVRNEDDSYLYLLSANSTSKMMALYLFWKESAIYKTLSQQ